MIDVLSMAAAHEARPLRSSAGTAWEREARAAIAAAAVRGIALYEEELIYLDVHDLQTLRWHFESGHAMVRHHHGHRAA